MTYYRQKITARGSHKNVNQYQRPTNYISLDK